MSIIKKLTSNYTRFSVHFIKFKSQNDVVFNFYGDIYRFTKSDLIACINYYLDRLSLWYGMDKDRINSGFVLNKFKYYELSVYLHGILQMYCNLVGLDPIGELFIKRFSHLPHDILKPAKEIKSIEYCILSDVFGGRYYTCVISGIALASNSLDELEINIKSRFPNLTSKYIIRFKAYMSF